MNLVQKFEKLEDIFNSRPKKEQNAVLEIMGVDYFEQIRNLFDENQQSTVTQLINAIKQASKGKINYFAY